MRYTCNLCHLLAEALAEDLPARKAVEWCRAAYENAYTDTCTLHPEGFSLAPRNVDPSHRICVRAGMGQHFVESIGGLTLDGMDTGRRVRIYLLLSALSDLPSTGNVISAVTLCNRLR